MTTEFTEPDSKPPSVGERDVLASRLAYLTVGLPTLGTIAAVVYALYDGLKGTDVWLFGVMFVITALGVEAGLHRYFTHRSFDASEPVKLFLGVAGSMAAQGPIVFWVANHRLHHAFADTDRDPHSPQPQWPGLSGRLKGLWHGHMGWLFTVAKVDWSRHTRDWLADRRVMRHQRPVLPTRRGRHRRSRPRRFCLHPNGSRFRRRRVVGRLRADLRGRPFGVGRQFAGPHHRAA